MLSSTWEKRGTIEDITAMQNRILLSIKLIFRLQKYNYFVKKRLCSSEKWRISYPKKCENERMFYVLSKGQPEIILEDYLNYIDTYHYGDSHERCLYTCKLMDTKQKGIIDFEDFRSYINLIIDTVKKVSNSLSYQSNIISESDIRHLFLHISKGKKYFDYNDFENIYQDKPELVSWFNYFNNDKEDILLIINENLQTILKEMYEFLIVFMDELFYLLDKENEINLDSIFQKVSKYNYKLEKVISMFIDKISKFKNITAFYNNKDQGYLNSRLINEIKNKTFKYNNETGKNYDSLKDLKEFFSDVKKSLYQKEEKEIQLNNEGLKPGKNEFINKESKLRRQSTIFSGKNFKFKDTDAESKAELLQWLLETERNEEKIAAVTKIYDRLGVRDAGEAEMERHTSIALEQLDKLPQNEATETLRELAEKLTTRKS